MSRDSCGAPKDSSAKNSNKKSYQVIPPSHFDDHRPAFKDALSFSRPKALDLNGIFPFLLQMFSYVLIEIRRLSISSYKLLDVWKQRYKQGWTEPKINGFKITPEHRGEHQAVFRLSVSNHYTSYAIGYIHIKNIRL